MFTFFVFLKISIPIINGIVPKNNIPIFSVGMVVSPKKLDTSGILTIIVCIHKVIIIEIIKNLLLLPGI